MRGFVVRWFGSALILMVVAEVMEHQAPRGHATFVVEGLPAAMCAVVALGVFNLVMHPLAEVVTTAGCLVNLLTLGLFGSLVSFAFWTLAFYIVGDVTRAIPGFRVDGLHASAVGAFWMSVGNFLLTAILHRDKDKKGR